jgi:hypothetical protein
MKTFKLIVAAAALAVSQSALSAYGDHSMLQSRSWDAGKLTVEKDSASTGASATARRPPAALPFDNRDPQIGSMPDSVKPKQRPGGGDSTTDTWFHDMDSALPK